MGKSPPFDALKRKGAMPRSMILLILLLIVIAAAIFFLSSQAREVPTGPMEVDVTNAVGR